MPSYVRILAVCTSSSAGITPASASITPPYAAQEIFEEFPDLGIVPLYFTALEQIMHL